MIVVKNKAAIQKMGQAGRLLSEIFDDITPLVRSGTTSAALNTFIEGELKKRNLVSKMKGYMDYQHVSCISLNDEVVHGVPSGNRTLKDGDIVKIDVCAAWKGYSADMARTFFVGSVSQEAQKLAEVGKQALDKGIARMKVGNRLSDISAAIQQEVEKHGFGVVRDFAGHGIGKQMHEDPEILNYGKPGAGPVLQAGMVFALEPMITMGHHDVYVSKDGWTVKTVDKSLAVHVEDTIVVTQGEPKILTRKC